MFEYVILPAIENFRLNLFINEYDCRKFSLLEYCSICSNEYLTCVCWNDSYSDDSFWVGKVLQVTTKPLHSTAVVHLHWNQAFIFLSFYNRFVIIGSALQNWILRSNCLIYAPVFKVSWFWSFLTCFLVLIWLFI